MHHFIESLTDKGRDICILVLWLVMQISHTPFGVGGSYFADVLHEVRRCKQWFRMLPL